MVRTYRKKPVEVEAVQWTGENIDEISAFCGASFLGAQGGQGRGTTLSIGTLEGPHIASTGDFIIKGVTGEFYPCKPDIFNATYEGV
ncbi:MAG: PGDYG domain-containing protein [Desulfovibrio sp.]|jgi:hypothetical protein|nr:PGDYG domain-containing protein [Desulfovibrio sp.]